MAEESKADMAAKESEADMAAKETEAKDIDMLQEDPLEEMSLAQAIRESYRITDATVAALLEEDKMTSVRNVLVALEDNVQNLPNGYGTKLEKLGSEFEAWTQELQETADRTEEELEENLVKRESAMNMREAALAKKAEAELRKLEAENEIAEYDEIVKNIASEGETLQAGRKTVRETLDCSQRVLLMLRDTVEQMRAATGSDEELKNRLFQEEEKQEKNPQVAMLRMMMNKRKMAGGTVTPRSGVSLSENEEGEEKKRVRGSDKPSEPKFPPKLKPEPKIAPDVLKEKERKEKERDPGSPAGKGEKGGMKIMKRQINPRWMLGSDAAESSQFHCFFCTARTRKAKDCPSMWEMVRRRNVPKEKIPASSQRQQQRADLYCQVCYDKGKGYDLLPENTTDRSARRTRYPGWNAHTYQKCFLYLDLSPKQKQEYDDEAAKVIESQSYYGGSAKNAKGEGKVIDVEAEDEKKGEKPGEPKSSAAEKKRTGGSAKQDIFTAPVSLPTESIIPNPKWGEEKSAQSKGTHGRPEEKKMPKKAKESKDKDKKEKRDKKEKKEKKERRANESPEKQSYSEKDIRDTE